MTQPAPSNNPALFRIIGALDSVTQSGTGYKARCPAHDDTHPSLGIAEGGDGRVLLTCRSNGCSAAAIVAALGLRLSDLFPESNGAYRWPIRQPDGTVVAFHNRRNGKDGTKPRWWEDTQGHRKAPLPINDMPLYGVAFLADADPGATVYLVEGERAADALLARGLHAVSTYGTSHKPNPAHLTPLAGFHVRLWPDNDAPGGPHMRDIAERLTGVAVASVQWVTWPDAPEKGDAADFDGSTDEIEAMVGEMPGEAVGLPLPLRHGPRLDVVRMADVRPEPVEWSWRGRFARGKATLLMGDPGLGKSLITHYSAAIVSTGGLWPDGERCERGTAILFTTEDGLADTVAPRLIAAGADMSRVLAVRGVFDKEDSLDARMFALTQHLALLEQLIEENDGQFVAIDPISAYLGPDVNSHKEADVRAVLAPLSLLAERTRIVLVMLMHLNKGTGVSALYRATGSIAFPAVARVVLGVAPDPNDEKRRLLLPIKMNIGKITPGIGYRIETHEAPTLILAAASAEDQPPVIVWDSEPVTIDATSALDRNGSAQELGAAAEVKDILRELLSNGKVVANECKRVIRETTGMTGESILSRARRDLGVKVHRSGFGQGSVWFWEIPGVPAIDPRAHARERINESMTSTGAFVSMEPPNTPIDTKAPIESMVATRAHAREEATAVQPPIKGARYCEDCGQVVRQADQTRCFDCLVKRREIVNEQGWVFTEREQWEDPNPPPELPF